MYVCIFVHEYMYVSSVCVVLASNCGIYPDTKSLDFFCCQIVNTMG